MEQKEGATRLARDFQHLSIEELQRPLPCAEELREASDQVMHACQCPLRHCESERCNTMKQILRHDIWCKNGGCSVCVLMWKFLKNHAQHCTESSDCCNVPHCRELKAVQ